MLKFNYFGSLSYENNFSIMSQFIIEEVDKYKATLYSNNSKEHEQYSIHLNIGSGEAIVKFFDENPAENTFKETVNNHNTFNLNVLSERFPNFIDILRNEKPVFFYFNKVTLQGYITTSDELVGEGDPKVLD